MKKINPVFMFGFERSGTTLLSMMIGAHREIAVPLSPTGLWYRYDRRLPEYGGLVNAGSVDRLLKDLLLEERIKLWDVDFTESELLPLIEKSSYASVVAAFHQAYAQKKGKSHWASNDISTLYSMDRANAWFPHAKFLHIVRDGRDVALSHETYKYGLSTTTEVADHWVHDLHTNIKMGAMIGPVRYKVVRYEDLVLEPENTLQAICTFIGIEYCDDMLKYPKMVEEKVPEDRRFLWPTLNQPPNRSNAYRWKTMMHTNKRIAFEWRANALLRQLGYEAYEKIPKSIGANFYDFWCYLGQGGRIRRIQEKLKLKSHK